MPLARGRYRQDEGTDQSTAAADPTAATSAAGGDNHSAADLMPTGKSTCKHSTTDCHRHAYHRIFPF